MPRERLGSQGTAVEIEGAERSMSSSQLLESERRGNQFYVRGLQALMQTVEEGTSPPPEVVKFFHALLSDFTTPSLRTLAQVPLDRDLRNLSTEERAQKLHELKTEIGPEGAEFVALMEKLLKTPKYLLYYKELALELYEAGTIRDAGSKDADRLRAFASLLLRVGGDSEIADRFSLEVEETGEKTQQGLRGNILEEVELVGGRELSSEEAGALFTPKDLEALGIPGDSIIVSGHVSHIPLWKYKRGEKKKVA
jgi:hypothetical protein